MTKDQVANQIARAVYESTGEKLSTQTATAVINAFADVIETAVANGDIVTLRGFGSFQSVRRGEKLARNITSGQPIIIPAHQLPVFVPSKDFKEKVRVAHATKPDPVEPRAV